MNTVQSRLVDDFRQLSAEADITLVRHTSPHSIYVILFGDVITGVGYWHLSSWQNWPADIDERLVAANRRENWYFPDGTPRPEPVGCRPVILPTASWAVAVEPRSLWMDVGQRYQDHCRELSRRAFELARQASATLPPLARHADPNPLRWWEHLAARCSAALRPLQRYGFSCPFEAYWKTLYHRELMGREWSPDAKLPDEMAGCRWLPDAAMASALLLGRPQEAAGTASVGADVPTAAHPPTPAGWQHRCGGKLLCSPDFGSVRRVRDGKEFTFAPNQRRVIEYMVGGCDAGRPRFTGKELFRASTSGASNASIRNVFHSRGGDHPAWGDLIVESEGGQGFYTLAL